MKKTTIRQKAYAMNYMKNHTKRYKIQLNTDHDSEVIAFLDSLENKNGYLKDLIRQDMKNRGLL